MRIVLGLVGVVLLAAGVLFMLQGSGLVMWPASSFMLAQTQWILRGAIVAVLGIVLLVVSRRGV